jgi:hypothetical protein
VLQGAGLPAFAGHTAVWVSNERRALNQQRPRVLNRGRFDPDPPRSKRVRRPSRFGNPFPLHDSDDDAERADVLRRYREWVTTSDEPITVGKTTYDPRWVRAHVHELRGLDLICSCSPEPCHADVLLELANRNLQSEPTSMNTTKAQP